MLYLYSLVHLVRLVHSKKIYSSDMHICMLNLYSLVLLVRLVHWKKCYTFDMHMYIVIIDPGPLGPHGP